MKKLIVIVFLAIGITLLYPTYVHATPDDICPVARYSTNRWLSWPYFNKTHRTAYIGCYGTFRGDYRHSGIDLLGDGEMNGATIGADRTNLEDGVFYVYPSASGTVVDVGDHGNSDVGQYVIIAHEGEHAGWYTMYAHFARPVYVTVGNHVDLNTRLGIEGDSGDAGKDNDHVHLALIQSATKPTVAQFLDLYYTTDPCTYLVNCTCERPPLTDPIGNLDSVDCNNIKGWAGFFLDPLKSVEILIYYDDVPGGYKYVASGMANQSNQSSERVFKILGTYNTNGTACNVLASCTALSPPESPCNHGFTIATPDIVKDGKPHKIYAFGLIQDISDPNSRSRALWNSGQTITCQPVPDLANCKNLTGPTTMTVGKSYTFTATYENGTGAIDGRGLMFAPTNCGTKNPPWSQEFGVNAGPGTQTWTVTPNLAGNYISFCDAWNDGITECRGDCVDGPPRYVCPGPNAKMNVTVVTPTPTLTTIPGDIWGAGGIPDGHVDMYDFNKMRTNFNNPYNIFNYNDLVSNFGK
jgi:hypothetical protein